MTQYKSISELKNEALEKLSGKFGRSMLVYPVIPLGIGLAAILPLAMLVIMPYLFVTVINAADVNSTSLIPIIAVLGIVLLLCQILLGVLNAGITFFFLKIACDRPFAVSDIFYGFRYQFKKSFAYSALTVLLSNILTLPYQIFSFRYNYTSEIKLGVWATVFYIIGMLIYIPIHLALSQYYYLMLDFPSYSIRELLRLSIHIMKGQKKKLFLLQLSFLPLELLCICSFYIGYLWLCPYTMMTDTLFFLDIMQSDSQNKNASESS